MKKKALEKILFNLNDVIILKLHETELVINQSVPLFKKYLIFFVDKKSLTCQNNLEINSIGFESLKQFTYVDLLANKLKENAILLNKNSSFVYVMKNIFLNESNKSKINDKNLSSIEFVVKFTNYFLSFRPRIELILEFRISWFDKIKR